MHTRRLLTLLLGFWLAGTLFSALIATGNFQIAEQISAHPPAEAQKWFETLGSENARLLLRHQAAEANRQVFEVWGRTDIALLIAIGIVLIVARARRLILVLTLVMLIAGIAATFLLTPQMVGIGRGLDFIPTTAPSPERARFGSLHGMYAGISLVRLLIGLAITGIVLYKRNRKQPEAES